MSILSKIKYDEEGLIAVLCDKVDGIGENTAIQIAGYMEDFSNFYRNTEKLTSFTKSKGTRFVSDKQIGDIKNIVNEYVPQNYISLNEIWVSIFIKDFVKNAIRELNATTIDSLSINPFLIKAFGFNDHREVIAFYFYQKITRSIVTSWGFTIEHLLKCSGAEKSQLAGFDMKVSRSGLNYHFQIKSSPVMSVEQVRALNTHFKNVEDNINNLLFLGISYGNIGKINDQIKTNLINYPHSVMIGKELWDFIAEQKDYYEQMLNWIDNIADEVPLKFSNELEKKLKYLIVEWEQTYSIGRESIDRVLRNFL